LNTTNFLKYTLIYSILAMYIHFRNIWMEDLLSKIKDRNTHKETFTGKPVGREL